MKRILCLTLALFCVMLILASCSSEPVAYSDKLFGNSECYIDAVEITPESSVDDSTFLYCKCKLSDGNMIWMEANYQDYIKYIDNEVNNKYETSYSEADKIDRAFTLRKITYDEPVRLQGVASSTKSDLGDYNEKNKSKVFRLVSADASVLTQPCTKTSTAVEFTCDERDYTVVYADISDVSPKYTELTDSIICECTASGGDHFYMNISIEDYNRYFDSSASFHYREQYKDTVSFNSPVRISGVTRAAKEYLGFYATSSDNEKQLICFKDIDQDQIAAEKAALDVSYDVIRIVPTHSNDYGSILVCECTTESDDRVLMRISAGQYKENFDPEFSYSTYSKLIGKDNVKAIEYDTPVTISGVAVKPEDIFSEALIKDDMPEKAFDFKEKE